ncbi:MAG: hypothetical protein ABR865_16385 [Terracidiphilus sp.]
MNLDNVLWFAYIGVEAVLVGLLFYRRAWRSFPIFLSYCIWDILSNLVLYAIGYSSSIYFPAYFTQTVLDSTLLFCVLVELAWSVLRPLRSSLARRSLVIVAAILLAAGAIIWPFAALSGLVHVASKQFLIYAQLQQTVSILRILFFLVLAAGSQWLSLSWRDRELQVATGLGFYSIVSVIASMLQAYQATASQLERLNRFVVAGFLCSLVYWVVSFTQKEAERRQFTPQMQNFLLAMAGAAHSTRVAMTESRSDKPPKQDQR